MHDRLHDRYAAYVAPNRPIWLVPFGVRLNLPDHSGDTGQLTEYANVEP
jgi:hypothetical protein